MRHQPKHATWFELIILNALLAMAIIAAASGSPGEKGPSTLQASRTSEPTVLLVSR